MRVISAVLVLVSILGAVVTYYRLNHGASHSNQPAVEDLPPPVTALPPKQDSFEDFQEELRTGPEKVNPFWSTFDELQEETDPDLQRRQLFVLLKEWARVDFYAAFSAAMSLFSVNQIYALEVLKVNLEKAPRQSLLEAESIDAGYENTSFVSQLLMAWLRTDYEAAMSYLDFRTDLLTGERIWAITRALGQQDPDNALSFVLTTGTDHGAALELVFSKYVQEHAEEAEAVLQTLEIPAQRSALLKAIADHHFKESPLNALEWLDRQIDGATHNELRDQLMLRWASQDSRQAVRYVSEQSLSDGQSRLLTLAIFRAAIEDTGLAIDLIKSVEEASQTDLTVSIATMLAHRQWENSMLMLDSLPEGIEKTRARLMLIQTHYRNDREEMDAQLQKYGLGP